MSDSVLDTRGWLRRLMVAGASALALAAVPAVATAQPDPGGGAPEEVRSGWVWNCPLHRVGDQLVRCDQLTAAGATAMVWLPAQRPTIVPSPDATTSPTNKERKAA